MSEESLPSALDEAIGYSELPSYVMIRPPSSDNMEVIMMDHSYCAAKVDSEDDSKDLIGELTSASSKLPPPEPLPPEQLLASPPRRSRRQMEKSESNEALEQSKEIERIKAFLDSEESVLFSRQLCEEGEESPNKQKRKPGRPPKADSPIKCLKESPKKRGRKKKDSISSQEDGEENTASLDSPSSEPTKKKRGRKPKSQIPLQEKGQETNLDVKSPHPEEDYIKSVLKNEPTKKVPRRTSVSFSSVLESSEPALFSQPDVLVKLHPNVTVEPLEMPPVLPSPKKESPLSLLEALDYNDDSSDSELPFSQETTISMKSIIGLKPTLSAKAKDKLKHLQLKFTKFKKDNPEPVPLAPQEDGKEKRKRKASVKVRELSPLGSDSDMEEDADSVLSEDDPNRLWCICRKPYDDRFMIQCDKCEDWFHGTCVKINKQKSRQIEKDNLEWLCPYCTGAMEKESKSRPMDPMDHPRRGPPSPTKKKSKPTTDPSKREAPTKKKDHSSSLYSKKFPSIKEYNKKGSSKHHKSSSGDHPAKKDSEKKRRSSQDKKEPSFSPLKDFPLEKKHKTSSSHDGNKEKDLCINTQEPSSSKKLNVKNIVKALESVKPVIAEAAKPKSCPSKEKKESKMVIPELPPEAKWKELPFKLEKPTKAAPPKTPVEKKKILMLKEKTSKEKESAAGQEESPKPSVSGEPPHKPPDSLQKCIQCKKVEVTTPPGLYCSAKCTEDYLAHVLATKSAKAKQLVLVDRVSGKQVTGFSEEKVLQWLKDHPSYEVSKSLKDSGTKDQKSKSKKPISPKDKSSPPPIRVNVKKCLKESLLARCKAASEVGIDKAKIEQIANNIEAELFKVYKDTNTKYKAKYRSLMFNIKDNKNEGLFQKIVKGIIAPDQLVRMSSEELASKELAKWRERENQHALEMIRKEQEEQVNVPLTKKTHKGEVEIDDSDLTQLESSDKIEDPLINFVDTTSKHKYHHFDLNCKICSGKIAPPLPDEPPAKRVKLSPPRELTPEPSLTPPRREEVSSTVGPTSPILEEEPASAWKGFIDMPEVSKFVTMAFKVSGPTDHLVEDIPEKLSVCGRIAPDLVWDYLTKIKQSGTKDLVVLRFIPVNEEEKEAYLVFYSYLHQRKRYAVVGNSSCMIKDFYLLPLASFSPIPTVLLPFDGPGLDSNRPPLLLGVLVRHRNKPRVEAVVPLSREEEYDPVYIPAAVGQSPDLASSPPGLPDEVAYASDDGNEAYDPDTLFSQTVVEETPDTSAGISKYLKNFSREDIDKLLTEILQSADPPGKAAAVIGDLVGHHDVDRQSMLLEMFTQQIESKKRQLTCEAMEEEEESYEEPPPDPPADPAPEASNIPRAEDDWHSSPSPPHSSSYHHHHHHRRNTPDLYRRSDNWSRRPRFHDRHYDHRTRKHWRGSEGGGEWRRKFRKHDHRRYT